MVEKEYHFKFGKWTSLTVLTFSIIGFVHVLTKLFGG